MMRFIVSTCGVVVEALAIESAGPPLVIGCAVLGLSLAAITWWTDFTRLIDRIIGLDLPVHHATKPDTEAD